jgi:hypothetical protein
VEETGKVSMLIFDDDQRIFTSKGCGLFALFMPLMYKNQPGSHRLQSCYGGFVENPYRHTNTFFVKGD